MLWCSILIEEIEPSLFWILIFVAWGYFYSWDIRGRWKCFFKREGMRGKVSSYPWNVFTFMMWLPSFCFVSQHQEYFVCFVRFSKNQFSSLMVYHLRIVSLTFYDIDPHERIETFEEPIEQCQRRVEVWIPYVFFSCYKNLIIVCCDQLYRKRWTLK